MNCTRTRSIGAHDTRPHPRRPTRAIRLRLAFALALAAVAVAAAIAQQPVVLKTDDGWTIHGDEYGSGNRAVVLVHGGRFTKESWRPQAQALAQAGLRVLAIDLRGYGMSKGSADRGDGSPLDVLAAARHLRRTGARTVSLVGSSLGADAVAEASMTAADGEIDAIVLLAGSGAEPGDRLKGRKLFIVAREDANPRGPRLPRIRAQHDAAQEPKRLLVLDGAAHAQALFDTDQARRLLDEITRFLLEQ
ncbi:MAG TPA: alpha/beta fold hydrolase [Vicinamibacterales bacterium]|nr:alpha/beta fold hydrolase [Vicinamibacterales bacterium]